MAHAAQLEFVKILSTKLPSFFSNSKVLEIGSLDINGSIRQFFMNCDYVGLDVAEGKGVDVVCQGQSYNAPDDSFDTVISCEAMEHNPFWIATINNMIRICKPGGLFILSCATTGRMEHGTTKTDPDTSPLTVELGWDYYKNISESVFRKNIELTKNFEFHHLDTNWSHYDLIFVGIKKGSDFKSPESLTAWRDTVDSIDEFIERENSDGLHKYREFMANVFGDRWFVFVNLIRSNLDWLHRAR